MASNELKARVASLINQPWAADGRNCWRLVREVVALFGVELPAVLDIAPAGTRGAAVKRKLFSGHPDRAKWVEVSAPKPPFAVAAMHRRGSRPDNIQHYGVWLPLNGGGVLHTDEPHGVVFDSLIELKAARGYVPRFFVPSEAA